MSQGHIGDRACRLPMQAIEKARAAPACSVPGIVQAATGLSTAREAQIYR